MKIEIRNDSVIIDGYVNAVGRDSRPLMPRSALFPDKCVEQVVPGSFKRSLENRSNVDLLINHDKSRKLGSTESGEITLNEDSIGLRAHAVITDPAAIEKARNGEFVGWSFGMYVNGEEKEERAGDIPRRKVTSLDLYEVSLIDRTMQPCYAGTSVECRADGETVSETRSFEDTAEIVNNVTPPDFSEYENKLAALRAQSDILDAEKRLEELRYNPYHDPTNGRFTSAAGGNLNFVYAGKGTKGQNHDRETAFKRMHIANQQKEFWNDIVEKNAESRDKYIAEKMKEYGTENSNAKMLAEKDFEANYGKEFAADLAERNRWIKAGYELEREYQNISKKEHAESKQQYYDLIKGKKGAKDEKYFMNMFEPSDTLLKKRIEQAKV